MASILSKLLGKKKPEETTNQQNTVHPTGTVRVDGLFWDCLVNNAEQKVDVIKKDNMGSVSIDILPTENVPEISWKAVQQITSVLLTDYLKKNGIHQFMPLKKPSFVWAGEVLEVCYYHDKNLHDKKFGELKTNLIMRPNDPLLLAKLGDLCRFYNLNPADYI
jgi:hypothetical protein